MMKKDWEIKKLGDVCEFRRGLTYSKNDEVENSSNAVLRSNNIDLITNRLDLSEIKYISDKIKIDETKKVKRDSLLICTANGSKAHLGKVALIDDDYDFAFGGFMGLLIPSESVYPRFFYYALISENYKKFIKSLSDGANINNLKFQDLSKFEIPIPPLEEQKRIVKILDEKFAQLESLKANAQTNLQNAKDLFQAKLTSIYNSNYSLVKVCEIATIKGGKRIPKGRKLVTENTGHPYIRVTDFTDNGSVSLDDIRYITEDIYQIIKRYTITVDDVFISIAGTIGKVGIVPTELNNANLTENACKLILKENVFNKYIVYIFLSDEVKKITQESARANAMPKLSILRLSEIEIPLPPLPEQKRIVKEFDTLSEKVRQLQEIYTKQIANCDELKQSYLQKAFEGEL